MSFLRSYTGIKDKSNKANNDEIEEELKHTFINTEIRT
jgi:hypothetical protein